jgi:hypothetical protein
MNDRAQAVHSEDRLRTMMHRAWHEAGVPMTRVEAFGKESLWPGDPDDVAATLGAAGFTVHLRVSTSRHETWIVVDGEATSRSTVP